MLALKVVLSAVLGDSDRTEQHQLVRQEVGLVREAHGELQSSHGQMEAQMEHFRAVARGHEVCGSKFSSYSEILSMFPAGARKSNGALTPVSSLDNFGGWDFRV